MKKLLLLFSIFSLSASAQVVPGIENMMPWLILDNISARELCLCHYEIDPMTIELVGTDKTAQCKLEIRNRVQQRLATPELPTEDDLVNLDTESLRDQVEETEGNDEIICSRRKVKRKISEYRRLQKKSLQKWKNDVTNILCHKEEVGRRQASKCREELVDMVSVNEDEVYKRCEESFLNDGRRRQINRCVEENIYKYLMATKDTSFFFDLCDGTTAEEKRPCIESLRNKLKKTYFKEDIKRCDPTQTDKFDARQVTGIKVCEDFLLSKVLGFATDEELISLSLCLGRANENDEEAINQCVISYRLGLAEKDLIDQLKDRYCPVPLYSANYGQYECVNDLITNYMNDMQLSGNCETSSEVLNARNDTEREAALAVCQRKEIYQSLLDKKVLEVADCWSRDQYPSLDDRRECRENAAEIDAQIRECENRGVKEQIIQCLQGIDNQEALQRYLLALDAQYENVNAQERCRNVSGTGYINCMLGVLYQDPALVERSNPLNCYENGDPQRCADQNYDVVGVNAFDATGRPIGVGGSNGGSGLNVDGNEAIVDVSTTGSGGSSNTGLGGVDDVVGLGSVGAATVGIVANGATGANGNGGSTSGGNGINRLDSPLDGNGDNSGTGASATVDSIGLDSVLRYASSAGDERTGIPACDTIIEVSREVAGAIGVSNISQNIANTDATRLVENSGARQTTSFEALGMLYSAGAAGNGMIASVSQAALVKLNEQIVAEERVIASGGSPTYCNNQRSSWFKKDYEFIKKSSAIALSELQKSRYKVKMINVYKEWESTFDNNHAKSEFSKYDPKVNMDKEQLRTYLITTIKLLMNITFPIAHAEQANTADGLSAIDDVTSSIGGPDAVDDYNRRTANEDRLPALDALLVLRDYITEDSRRSLQNRNAYIQREQLNNVVRERLQGEQ